MTILSAYRKWLRGLKGTYLFRGHVPNRLLSTSLEHACADWGIPPGKIPHVETALIREFRRSYTGPDYHFVDTDTLYCMALMRHHGAPVRLLDFTYSALVKSECCWINRLGMHPRIERHKSRVAVGDAVSPSMTPV